MSSLEVAMLGGVVVSCIFASVHFIKFWSLTRDRFFVWFALAFALFGGSFAVRAITPSVLEQTYYSYLPRLVGFVLIGFAIFDKNRRSNG